MYYVVFLVKPRKYIVIPHNWLRDGDNLIMEKFINQGLNSNQKHLCFWSEEGFDGAPNFNANVADEFPSGEQQACYICYVLKFKCKCVHSPVIFDSNKSN